MLSSMKRTSKIPCIASDTIPLWECPCRVCTHMDWEALDDSRPLLRVFRQQNFPEVYGEVQA